MQFHENQLKAIDTALNSDHRMIFITGGAGTGKSAVFQHIRSEYLSRGMKVIAVAPTNQAARIIGGTTIAKQFGIKPEVDVTATKEDQVQRFSTKSITLDTVDSNTILMIDEASMLGFTIFDAIISRVEAEKVILFGDLDQLPPVNDIPVNWTTVCDAVVRLTKNYRAKSPSIAEHLTTIKTDGTPPFTDATPDLVRDLYSNGFTFIAYRNATLSALESFVTPAGEFITFGQCVSHRTEDDLPYFTNGDTVTILADKPHTKINDDLTRYFCKKDDIEPIGATPYSDDYPAIITGDYAKYKAELNRRFARVDAVRRKIYARITGESVTAPLTKEQLARVANHIKHLKQKHHKSDKELKMLNAWSNAWKGYFDIKETPFARDAQFITAHKAQGKSIDKVAVVWNDLPTFDLKYVAASRAINDLVFLRFDQFDTHA